MGIQEQQQPSSISASSSSSSSSFPAIGVVAASILSNASYTKDTSNIAMSDCSGRTGRTCSGLSCVVCLEAFVSGEELIVLPQCKHRFHAACITQWLRQANSCPSCRTLAVQREPPRPEITAMATPELATAAASALSRTNTDGQMSRAQPPLALSNNSSSSSNSSNNGCCFSHEEWSRFADTFAALHCSLSTCHCIAKTCAPTATKSARARGGQHPSLALASGGPSTRLLMGGQPSVYGSFGLGEST